jgi:hypothetical protein
MFRKSLRIMGKRDAKIRIEGTGLSSMDGGPGKFPLDPSSFSLSTPSFEPHHIQFQAIN